MEFGPRVQADIDELHSKCKNVLILCSKSGKLHKEHVRVWVNQIVDPILDRKSVLLLGEDNRMRNCLSLY